MNEVETIPGHPNCVYAGLGFVSQKAQHRGGVQFSSSNGDPASWTSLTSGLDIHQAPVADILLPGSNPLVASYGRGLWIYYWNPLPAACQ